MNFKSIIIKKATWKDYQYCYRLTKKNMFPYFKKYWGGWNPKAFRKDFNPLETKIILKNNRRIGFYVLQERNNCFYISNIQISPTMTGKGIGTYVLFLIEKQVSETNKNTIQLTVFKDNPAKKLYQKFGYRALKDKGDSILMKKEI